METTQIILIALAVVAIVIYRQMRPKPVARPLGVIIPVVMVLIGVSGGGLVDARHTSLSVAVLVVELLVAAGLGVLRAMTTRVWRDQQGVAWSQGGVPTLVAWVGSIAVRVAMMALTSFLGIASSQNSILLFIGVTLGVQFLVVARRANALPGAAVPGAQTAR
ncbi:hypothetical protein [Microbispora hainanensis]|uniref:DUF1453 domain-containing protein n=1 Tax=Microbispora hainanensis TaxID=568844 RepID=A0A544Z4C5_9ACTN|nr:hypothetical protein [Microbispora hainanensis]TQS23904.1 hypothetical protein FLX08_02140 [Microbispora hainanensis]